MASKRMGERQMIEPTDEEWVTIHAKERRVKIATNIHTAQSVINSFRRRHRERKRMTFTPCAQCVIRRTCAKRKRHGLKGCEYAIVATPDGPKASCSVYFVEQRTRFKKGGKK